MNKLNGRDNRRQVDDVVDQIAIDFTLSRRGVWNVIFNPVFSSNRFLRGGFFAAFFLGFVLEVEVGGVTFLRATL